MVASEVETTDRSRMWHLLSAFYLDEHMTSHQLSSIAARCAESKYTIEELDIIMFREVYPALIHNTWAPIGEWVPWSEEEVAARVRKCRYQPTPVRWWQFITWRDWSRLKCQVRQLRRCRELASSNKSLERTREP